MKTMKTKSSTPRSQGDQRLLKEIGSAVGRLIDTIGGPSETSEDAPKTSAKTAATASEDRRRTAPARLALVEQALGAAEEVESFLAEQSARIAYLENLTLTDELTGLRNRRGFNEQLRRTLAAANRYADQGVLVFCDLDNFKTINGTFGHHVGDYVLKQLAKVIEAEVRETDVVARLGGDEFAVLMIQTNWRDGIKRADAEPRRQSHDRFLPWQRNQGERVLRGGTLRPQRRGNQPCRPCRHGDVRQQA